MQDSPLVSVCLITYNHAKYIAQAIDGVLLQQVDFSWELIIADDCSTDGTREIIQEYQRKHPDKIRLILQSQNVGPARNWLDLVTSPAGKYIAYFEGDDYWTHPLKLQKQVDFLEANPDYSICFHRVFELEEGKMPVFSSIGNPDTEETFTLADLARKNIIQTLSAVYRRKLANELPPWFIQAPAGDYVLHMLNAAGGKIKYFPEPMAVYRKNVGIWSTQSYLKMWERWLTVLDLLIAHFEGHEIVGNLRAHKEGIILQVIDSAKQREKDFRDLVSSPQALAGHVSGKNLVAALGHKITDQFKRKK